MNPEVETIVKICPCDLLAKGSTSFRIDARRRHVHVNLWEPDQPFVHDISNEVLHVSSLLEDVRFFRLIQPRTHEPLVGSGGQHVEVCIKANLTLQDLLSMHIRFRAYRKALPIRSCCVEIQKPKPLC